MSVKFYGTRGSLPASHTAANVKAKVAKALQIAKERNNFDIIDELPFEVAGTYGGSTTCCMVRYGVLAKEKHTIVLDLGSGISNFGRDILPEMFRRKGIHIDFLMSHVHWDHIQGFPFFAPIFISREILPFNQLVFYGGTTWQRTLENALRGQMDGPVFPVEWEKINSEGPHMDFKPVCDYFKATLSEGILVRCRRLHHPQETYGWRLEFYGKIFVFATDTEPFDGGPDPVLVGLAQNADVLYLDCQYSREQYLGKIGGVPRLGWGHGYDTWCAEVAKVAHVKKLYLGHHDPASSDEQISALVNNARRIFPESYGAFDGLEINI